jgi:hypothetical protein
VLHTLATGAAALSEMLEVAQDHIVLRTGWNG